MQPPPEPSPGNSPQKVEEVSFEILPPERDQHQTPPPTAPPQSERRPPSGFLSTLGIVIAVAADAMEIAVPPSWLLVDAVTVAAFILIWGFRWEIFVALLPEAIPGIDFFPTWTLLAAHLNRDRKN